MFYKLITQKRDRWFNEPDCPVKDLVEDFRKKGKLRTPQLESIKTYLFLKFAGQNKSLAQLFKEGFFCTLDFSREPLTAPLAYLYEHNPAARSVYEYAKALDDSKKRAAKSSRQHLASVLGSLVSAAGFDYDRAIDQFFYGVTYSDYIFSLPMGAGKTFLMAAFIYIDLYFAELFPDDPVFAHNFMILAPSGLKSSIMPSLRTIADFDPAWLFDQNTAYRLSNLIKIEILDEQASAKKSNRVRNPNAQKIAFHQPFDQLLGLVIITNAEKVILDGFAAESSAEKMMNSGNELRALIDQIPQLSIFIDEVHHASSAKKDSEEVKLRKVVEHWARDKKKEAGTDAQTGSIVSVLGFSGTPYVEKTEKIELGPGIKISSAFLNNVVYYYPLSEAVAAFLKKPVVSVPATDNVSREFIIRQGLEEFFTKFSNTVYPAAGGDLCAKIAVFCGQIEELETEIYPLVCGIVRKYGFDPSEAVLKFHRGGKGGYVLPKENEKAFANLDSPLSRVRVILLAQIGKEGWDCRSLTGVILSSANSCRINMVLQTCCRCLRQASSKRNDKALIWLNRENSLILDQQLQKDHDLTLEEFKALGDSPTQSDRIPIHHREEAMKLGRLIYFDMRVKKNLVSELKADTKTAPGKDPVSELLRLKLEDARFNEVTVKRLSIKNLYKARSVSMMEDSTLSSDALITFPAWLHLISREAGLSVSMGDLENVRAALEAIFYDITTPHQPEYGIYRFNPAYDQQAIRSAVRRCFAPVRTVCDELSYEKLGPLPFAKPVYAYAKEQPSGVRFVPDEQVITAMLEADLAGSAAAAVQQLEEHLKEALAAKDYQKMSVLAAKLNSSGEESDNERLHSFHYVPYRLQQGLEYSYFINDILGPLTKRGLDVLYNGDNALGQLEISCYRFVHGSWQRASKYRPDFLIMQRDPQDGRTVKKILIVETKGTGFEKNFEDKRQFMQEFIKFNREQRNPIAFDFLYVPESEEKGKRLTRTMQAVQAFFD